MGACMLHVTALITVPQPNAPWIDCQTPTSACYIVGMAINLFWYIWFGLQGVLFHFWSYAMLDMRLSTTLSTLQHDNKDFDGNKNPLIINPVHNGLNHTSSASNWLPLQNPAKLQPLLGFYDCLKPSSPTMNLIDTLTVELWTHYGLKQSGLQLRFSRSRGGECLSEFIIIVSSRCFPPHLLLRLDELQWWVAWHCPVICSRKRARREQPLCPCW